MEAIDSDDSSVVDLSLDRNLEGNGDGSAAGNGEIKSEWICSLE